MAVNPELAAARRENRAARRKHEIARLAVNTAVLERRAAILAKYDATESSTMRRQPVRERTDEGGIYTMRHRTLGTNIGRDLERNYSPARGILHQYRMNVVGALGKLQVNVEGGDDASAWFNGDWAQDCDYRGDGTHFSTILQNVVASAFREGDLLGMVDDGLVDDSGKLLHWESDQIVPLSEVGLKTKGYEGKDIVQDNGIIRGKFGKILAYVVTGKRGATVVEADDATVFKVGDAWLVTNPWRLNQGRGIPALITSATNILDLYEILGKELISAKRATQIAGFVERSDAVTNWDDPGSAPEWNPENSDKSAATVAAEGANDSTDNSNLNYERFEALTGGLMEYGAKGDKMVFPDINRPNVKLPEFIEAVLGFAGASVGLARAYTVLRADSSYTSFRGDMILTWAGAFYPTQKWLERSYADRVARKVLAWAQRKGKIPALPAGWERALSWQWPTIPHVDELKEESATEQALRNGTSDFSDLLGPNWKTKFEALAEQVDYGRKLNLPLSILTAKTGGTPFPADGDATEAAKKAKEQA